MSRGTPVVTHRHDGTDPASDESERERDRLRMRARRALLRAYVATARELRAAAARHSASYRARRALVVSAPQMASAVDPTIDEPRP